MVFRGRVDSLLFTLRDCVLQGGCGPQHGGSAGGGGAGRGDDGAAGGGAGADGRLLPRVPARQGLWLPVPVMVYVLSEACSGAETVHLSDAWGVVRGRGMREVSHSCVCSRRVGAPCSGLSTNRCSPELAGLCSVLCTATVWCQPVNAGICFAGRVEISPALFFCTELDCSPSSVHQLRLAKAGQHVSRQGETCPIQSLAQCGRDICFPAKKCTECYTATLDWSVVKVHTE
jgi:hypothetical protein